MPITQATESSKQKEKIGSNSEKSLNVRLAGLLQLLFSTTVFGMCPILQVNAVQSKGYLFYKFDDQPSPHRQNSHDSGLFTRDWLTAEAPLIHLRENLLSGDFPLHML